MVKLKLIKYSEKFPVLFKREKAKLEKILTKDAIIEHTGSSAVPGLIGKGNIDISVSVNKKSLMKNAANLKKAGYALKSKAFNMKSIMFFGICKEDGKTREVHIHLTHSDNPEMRKAVALVKYMKAHPGSAKEYAAIKNMALRHSKGKRKEYQDYKRKFLTDLGEKALEKYGNLTAEEKEYYAVKRKLDALVKKYMNIFKKRGYNVVLGGSYASGLWLPEKPDLDFRILAKSEKEIKKISKDIKNIIPFQKIKEYSGKFIGIIHEKKERGVNIELLIRLKKGYGGFSARFNLTPEQKREIVALKREYYHKYYLKGQKNKYKQLKQDLYAKYFKEFKPMKF